MESLVLVDSGGLFSTDMDLEPSVLEVEYHKSRILLNGMKKLGYDAVALGDSEFLYGLEKLELLMEQSGLTFVCSNLKRSDNTFFASPYLIKTVHGMKIGIFALLTEETINQEQYQKKKNITGLRIEDPFVAAESMVKELRSKVDLLLCLSHLGSKRDRLLASKFTEIDVILGGHDRRRILFPMVANNSIITHGCYKDQYLGRLDMTVMGTSMRKYDPGALENLRGKLARMEDEISRKTEIDNAGISKLMKDRDSLRNYLEDLANGGIFFKGGLIPLDSSIYKDDDMKEFIRKEKLEVAELYDIHLDKGDGDGSYTPMLMGVDICASCHSESVAWWRSTRHANAWKTLEKSNETGNIECVFCHAAGYSDCITDLLASPEMRAEGVNCEACHGPSAHLDTSAARSTEGVDDSVCRKCHDKENSPDYIKNPSLYWEKIKHH